ncbi:hypothetical protein LRS06_21730 [Hymenobacter sp. J193]|uniref:hypothetical protein n=1 Tax=Hymenobacter sp. J193 TaxID=2898429 RepID=UPI00215147B9|nr:hypothetical protein [Hymenobacter sp. J193]MCR5890351.1 hypothetical protein [Hymenobacter sp. J193]
MRLLPTRAALTASAREANALLRQNPAAMSQEEAQHLLASVTACLQQHDNDPLHIV